MYSAKKCTAKVSQNRKATATHLRVLFPKIKWRLRIGQRRKFERDAKYFVGRFFTMNRSRCQIMIGADAAVESSESGNCDFCMPTKLSHTMGQTFNRNTLWKVSANLIGPSKTYIEWRIAKLYLFNAEFILSCHNEYDFGCRIECLSWGQYSELIHLPYNGLSELMSYQLCRKSRPLGRYVISEIGIKRACSRLGCGN